MTHNATVELQQKCRKVAYLKVERSNIIIAEDGSEIPGEPYPAGMVFDVFSGGGAQEDLTGDDLLIARYNDLTAPEWLGCIEIFYNRIDDHAPVMVDLAKVGKYLKCVEVVRTSQAALKRLVWERSLSHSKSPLTETGLREALNQATYLAEDTDEQQKLKAIIDELDSSCLDCDNAMEKLLDARDRSITFSVPEPKPEDPGSKR